MEYTYPEDIKTEKFKYRHIEIKAYKPAERDNALKAKENAHAVIKEGVELANKAANTAKEMISNLKQGANLYNGDLEAIIVLPLPNTFTDSQTHDWSTETGVVSTLGSKFLEKGVLGSDVSINKAVGQAAALSGMRRPLIDPGYFQNYTGSQPRSFSMQFDLVPNNPKEAEDIITIVMKLKQLSSPSRALSNVALLAPYYFSIDICNEYIQAMAKIDQVVLKDISIDYGADGFMQQHADGVPKQMSLTLTWQETKMTVAQDYSTVPAVKEKI